MVTDAQVRRLREKRMDGKTLAAAAAAAGMCERTARRWQEGPLPSASTPSRTWRTRPDPFAEIWASDIVPRLATDEDRRLQSLTLFEWLCDRYPGRFQPGQLRTLQRRVRDWRAQHGPDQEAYFEQTAVPGREGALDFTDASDLGVTIQGEERIGSGIAELDRVLGGGLVPGALVLVGGDPGIGKSTLLLQALGALAAAGRTCLYVTAEESLRQVKMRADRLGISSEALFLLAETQLDAVDRLDHRELVLNAMAHFLEQKIFLPLGVVRAFKRLVQAFADNH